MYILFQFHADMYHMAMEQCSTAGADRIRETSHNFIDTVYQMLKSCRLITYA